jgi:hypothetical protein
LQQQTAIKIEPQRFTRWVRHRCPVRSPLTS